MCFNSDVSLATFAFGSLTSIYIFYNSKNVSNKAASIFLFFVSLMQLIEFVLWENQLCNTANKYASLSIVALLYMQVLVSMLIYYYLPYSKRSFSDNTYYILFTIFTLTILYFLNDMSKNLDKICSFKDKDSCRLVWKPLEYMYNQSNILFILAVSLYFFLIKSSGYVIPNNSKFLKKYFVTIVLLFSVLYGIFYKGSHFITIFGSVWCFLVVFYGLVLIFDS